MKDAARKMALILKERNNKSIETVAIGVVVSLSPLTVNDGNDILLDSELVITYNIQRLIEANILEVGNQVYMTANGDYSRYVVVDKVVS